MMKKWEVLSQFKVQSFDFAQDESSKLKVDELIRILLQNRGVKTEKEIDTFLNPKLEDVTVDSVEIDRKELRKALKRIQKAIKEKEQIIVFGDYDVDGICGTAILWETLNSLGANVMPYIPHRVDEGYGLSIKGIQNVILNLFQDPNRKDKKMLNQVQHDNDKLGLIITVDNGIVANEAVKFANDKGIDVIITDHHSPPAGGSKKLPDAFAIVHTTKLCGTGVAWMLAQQFKVQPRFNRGQSEKLKVDKESDHLGLVALATVADVMPLTGANRTVTKSGLEHLRKTQRIGLLALFRETGIEQKTIETYHIGHMIAPRLNAMGRLEYAMDSLRLLCTRDKIRAMALADKLGSTNKERQGLTQEAVLHAKKAISNKPSAIKKLLFIGHESYQPGIIGLVAGKLVEEFYRPSIVLSIGQTHSKASARSISGFNIIEFIRSASVHLVDAGGHPMAAGFTVETAKISVLQQFLENKAAELLSDDLFVRILRIDCELPLTVITKNLYQSVQSLAPFGMGNPEPTFVSRDVVIEDIRVIGKDGKHLKFRLATQCHSDENQNLYRSRVKPGMTDKRDSGVAHAPQNDDAKVVFEAVAFGLGERKAELQNGQTVDIVYTIDENTWNGSTKLQLKIKDIKS